MKHWKRHIETLLDEWIPILGLDQWTINRHYLSSARADDGDCQADTVANWQYMYATLRFYKPHFKLMDEAEAERVVLHELSHVLLSCMEAQISDKKTDHRERTVEETARALLRARQGIV